MHPSSVSMMVVAVYLAGRVRLSFGARGGNFNVGQRRLLRLHAGEEVIHVVVRGGGHRDALGDGKGAHAAQPDDHIRVGPAGEGHPVVDGLAGGVGHHLVEDDVLHALLVQDVLDLVDHLALVQDCLGDQEGPLTVLGDELSDPVDGIQAEDDASRDVKKDVRHGSLSP
ncbi:MAG: hypothetical protein ABSG63_21415 [Spirochaetia bacterium]